MKYEPTDIISRIEWCRLQQQLHSIRQDERADWCAEEAGLVDALFGKDRTALMREVHRPQLMRYQCGLEDGRALLRLNTPTPWGTTRMEDVGSTPLMTPAQVDRRPSQAPSPTHVESGR